MNRAAYTWSLKLSMNIFVDEYPNCMRRHHVQMPIHDRFLNVEDQVFSIRKRSLLSPNTVYLYIA